MLATTEKYELYTPEELLEFYLNGETAALAALIDQCGERLFLFLYHYLGAYPAAAEIYTATWAEIARRASTYNSQTRFAFWLYATARDLAQDKIPPAAALVPMDKIINVLTEKLSPQTTVEDFGRRLTQAVMLLPAAQREVFLLREDADLTYWEISEILGCARETAQNNLRAALGNLADAVAGNETLQRLLAKL